MMLKTIGLGLVTAGIINTGAGVLQLVGHASEVSLIGLGALIFGAAAYLAGAVEDAREAPGGGRKG